MQPESLVTQEQLDVLKQAEATISVIRANANAVGRTLPEGQQLIWRTRVGINGCLIGDVGEGIGRLTSMLAEVEAEF
jgi:hypothetical protein